MKCLLLFLLAQIADISSYSQNKIQSTADYSYRLFPFVTNFSQCHYYKEALYKDCRFYDSMQLKSSEFDDLTDFTEACFYGKSRFRDLDFSSSVVFDDARFSSYVSFSDLAFHGDTEMTFNRTILPDTLIFDYNSQI